MFTKTSDLAFGTLDAALKYGSNSLRNSCLSYTFHNPHTFSDLKKTVAKSVRSSLVGAKRDVIPVLPPKKKDNAIINEISSDPLLVEMSVKSSKNDDHCRLQVGNASSEWMNPTLFWEQLENITKQKGFSNDISEKILAYASKYTKDAIRSSDLLNVSRDTLIQFLSFDPTVQEIELLDRVAKWIEQKPSLDKTQYEVLERIRFDNLTPQEFCSFLSKHERVLP